MGRIVDGFVVVKALAGKVVEEEGGRLKPGLQLRGWRWSGDSQAGEGEEGDEGKTGQRGGELHVFC